MTYSRQILSAAVLLSVFCFASSATAQDQTQVVEDNGTLHQDMLGEWLLSGKPDAEIVPAPGARMKIFGKHHWIITEHDPDTGVVIFHHGGTYELDGDSYTEKLTFANDSTKHMIGMVFKFKIKVADGKFTQIGDGNPFSEVWTSPKK